MSLAPISSSAIAIHRRAPPSSPEVKPCSTPDVDATKANHPRLQSSSERPQELSELPPFSPPLSLPMPPPSAPGSVFTVCFAFFAPAFAAGGSFFPVGSPEGSAPGGSLFPVGSCSCCSSCSCSSCYCYCYPQKGKWMGLLSNQVARSCSSSSLDL